MPGYARGKCPLEIGTSATDFLNVHDVSKVDTECLRHTNVRFGSLSVFQQRVMRRQARMSALDRKRTFFQALSTTNFQFAVSSCRVPLLGRDGTQNVGPMFWREDFRWLVLRPCQACDQMG